MTLDVNAAGWSRSGRLVSVVLQLGGGVQPKIRSALSVLMGLGAGAQRQRSTDSSKNLNVRSVRKKRTKTLI